ncbi:MAG: hypothetical protein KU38_01905 [Sulfurovum sp. FS08-3]|nr:MAG: hypothetical protein KU38_01905 [Sulfurovum sp. FS08-3]
MPKIISLSSIKRSRYDKIKKDFRCSTKELEEYIKQYAFSHQKDGLYQTYFYLDDEENYLGYISVAISSIDREKIDSEIDIPTSIKYEIPALKITRLCTFDNHCKKGVGTKLVIFCEILALALQKKVGCRAIIVDSKKDAVGFYTQCDFTEIAQEDDDNTIFMVYDLLKKNELNDELDDIITFCKMYGQNDLIEILKS